MFPILLTCVILCFIRNAMEIQASETAFVANMALNRPVEQSSIDNTFTHSPKNGVDGKTDNIIRTANDEDSAWFKVDLQTQVQDATIYLYLRVYYTERRNGVKLYTSPTPFLTYPSGQLCHSIESNDSPDVVNVVCGGTWRFVMVYTDTDNDGKGPILDFRELEVFASVFNLALNKPVEMSSIYINLMNIYPPQNAVDGTISTFVHTAWGQGIAWFTLDVQMTVRNAMILIHMRREYKARRNGVKLYTSLTPFTSHPDGDLCHTITGLADGTDIPDTVGVPCAGVWRYVMVFTSTGNDNGGPLLDFEEIEVLVSEVNLALNRNSNMSSLYANNPSSYGIQNAMDGNLFSFMVTGADMTEAWFTLDLETRVQDATIRLYLRLDYLRRRNGVQIYTSETPFSGNPAGQLCLDVTGSGDGTDITDVQTVKCGGNWRYIMVYTATAGDIYGVLLEFAEIEVVASPKCMLRNLGPSDCSPLKFNVVGSGSMLSDESAMYIGSDRNDCIKRCVQLFGCLHFSLTNDGVCKLSTTCYPVLQDNQQSDFFSMVLVKDP